MRSIIYIRSLLTLLSFVVLLSSSDSLYPCQKTRKFPSAPSLQSMLNPMSSNYGNKTFKGLSEHMALFKYALLNYTEELGIGSQHTTLKSFRTFDTCRVGKTCRGDRQCVIYNERVKECQDGSFCICSPQKLLYCTSRKVCEKGEICAQSDFDPRPYCVSRVAEKRYPFFQKIISPPKMPTNGLSFDRCDGNSPCSGDRKCMSVEGVHSFVPCEETGPCFCTPKPVVCFSSASCIKGEICADLPFLNISTCVSLQQEKLLESIKEVQRPAVSKGFTFDPCTKNEQCRGNRSCKRFDGIKSPCEGNESCACIPKTNNPCHLTSECASSEEVCAKTPFTRNPVCVSIDARDAHDGIEQVINVDPCPVRITEDEPLNSFLKNTGQAGPLTRLSLQSNIAWKSDKNISTSARIIGGLFSPPNVVRYMAVVRVNLGELENLCTGTLLSPKWILTARHCGAKEGDSVSLGARQAFTSFWGDGVRANRHGKEIRIKRVISHPMAFNTVLGFDFSVLELEEAAPEDSGFMQLNENTEEPSAGDIVRVVGYGLISSKNLLPETVPGALRQVDVDVSDWSYCRDKYSRFIPINQKRHICTGSRRQLCESCQGDSGGPVIRYKEGLPVLLGVTSFGIGCALPGVPGVSAAISGGLSWLKSTGAVFFTSKGVFGDDTSACAPGEYVFSYLPGVTFCRPCHPKSVSVGGSTKFCKRCPHGFVRDPSNGLKCTEEG